MGSNLRVLMLSQYPISKREEMLGGIIQTTMQLVNGFSSIDPEEIDLCVFSVNEDCNKPSEKKVGPINIYCIPKSKTNLGIIFFDPIRIFFHICKIIRKMRPHVLHAQGNATFILLSLIYGRRSVQTVHGIFRNEQKTVPRTTLSTTKRLLFFLHEVVESFYLRRIRTLIATSTQLVELARASGGRPKNIVWINNCVDEAFFDATDEKPVSRDFDGVTFLCVAVLTPRKGIHFLVEAFKRLSIKYPHARLRIVGPAAAPDYVNEQQLACGSLFENGRIVFTGGLSFEDLVSEYRSADVFVLPSLGETAPVAISQALCIGLPVVSTFVGGIPDMIDQGQTGLLVQPGDVAALHDALEELLIDEGQRRRWGAQARKVAVDRYHPLSNARKTLDIYRSVSK
jgi:glycosyltransferase involved in cell wall biosynthesis